MVTKLKLTLAQRFTLLNILPESGKLQIMVAAKSLRKKFEITPELVDEFKIQEKDNNGTPVVVWDPKVEADHGKFEFDIDTQAERDVLINAIESLDKAERITPDLVDIALFIMEWKVIIPEESAEEIAQ